LLSSVKRFLIADFLYTVKGRTEFSEDAVIACSCHAWLLPNGNHFRQEPDSAVVGFSAKTAIAQATQLYLCYDRWLRVASQIVGPKLTFV